jgi:hypothetical protein
LILGQHDADETHRDNGPQDGCITSPPPCFGFPTHNMTPSRRRKPTTRHAGERHGLPENRCLLLAFGSEACRATRCPAGTSG